MKILLIYPNFLDDRLHAEDVRVVPIGLYYIGALLKENHFDVEILNWHNINKTPHKIEETLKEKKPDVIGFSIVHANRWGGIEIAAIAKRILPDVKIVFGGIGATFLWEHLMKHFREIDYAVIGEGEYSFLSLVQCIEKKHSYGINEIKGIVFRQGEKVVKTSDAEVIQDLDRLPMPSKYFEFQHLSSSRGCPSNCTFCGSPKFWGHRVRFHSSEYFVEQLESLCRKGITFFYVSDDTFTMRKDRVIEICKKIIEKDLKITWVAISRVNYVNEEMLCWMRKAGCIQISYGVESGSEKIREVLNKNIKTGMIRKAFALTTSYGILARAYFIYGSPGESWKTIQETMDLIHEIKPLSTIFYILDIFPGTALYEDFQQKTKLGDDVWLKRVEDIMYFETDPRLTEDMILAFGKKLRSDYYLRLPGFADTVQLVDKKDLFEYHADFLSRLAMTFSHGDYAAIEAIPGKEEIAQRLYERSLSYHPTQRAYLGLGIIRQKQGKYDESLQIFSEGTKRFPGDGSLAISLGISYMNLGQYREALECFNRFSDSREALKYTAACYRALGDSENESSVLRKLERLSGSDRI
ncbi:MAG: B12-binding domain-containing radical SAM protein [Nitrospirae bacterium RBG_13_39_12]|nr:MAG: B12-binding domain-containing radical SAM protein [Nitrospirae bacterium RBG_13_39_12]